MNRPDGSSPGPFGQPITSRDAPFREAAALSAPAGRATQRRYMVEGETQILQALASPSRVHGIFSTAAVTPLLRQAAAARQAPVYDVSRGLLQKLVGTSYETAIHAVAVVGQRAAQPESLGLGSSELILAAEHIQDPRNVGVLIRTAEAAGCSALLLSACSAEPWSRASVRSTTGSILRLPICVAEDLAQTLRALSARVRIVASSAHAGRLVFDEPMAERPLVVAVGNESAGISTELREAADSVVALPMAQHGASSLNVTVAAGALLYEAVRQRLKAG